MAETKSISGVQQQEGASKRLTSIDALRGFDMFWIIGMEEVFKALTKMTGMPIERSVQHVGWAGLHFYDTIFPLFAFIIGVSLVFSLTKSLETEGRKATTWKVIKRGAILFLIGILYYGGLSKGIDHVRVLGVLQRLALCYLFAGLAFCWLGLRGRVVLFVSLLIGYWAMMTFIPVPGVGAGNYAETKNLSDYVDKMWLPLRKYNVDHDPEGLLSTLPAIASCLCGVFAGMLLKNNLVSPQRKVRLLFAGAAISMAAGLLWSLQFPIIKKIWTSSFVLVTSGINLALMAVFYQVIDIWQKRAWATPFVWIGANAITIYLGVNLIGFDDVANRLFGGEIKQFFDHTIREGCGELVITVATMGLILVFLRFLYQRKIFLRI